MMQRFTIDYLTGNMGSSYPEPNGSSDAEIHVANHDGLLTHIGSNYLHTSLHLEDVYSIINKDTETISANKHVMSPLAIDSNYATVGSETSPLVADSSYVSIGSETSPLSSPPTNSTGSESEVSSVSSPAQDSTENEYHYTLERATPSPNKDSGIESDNSPVSSYTTENVNKSLRELEKKADKIKASKTTTTDKPSHSYIALIAMALLDSRDRKMTLGDIYRHIMDNHPYYNNEEKAWRNSIRYNLSINECFIKAGKDELAGKGNLWGIHPACLEDFKNGDFRRRQARRRAKKTLKGIGPADSNPAPEYSARISSAYQTMTPSYVNYHPYATSGLMQRQQQMTDYTHAYNGHIPMPSASYYNTLGHYPAAQYTSMGMSNYSQPTYDYIQQFSRGYSGYEVTNATGTDSAAKSRHEESGLKYYPYSTTDNVPSPNDVPSNNNIEIL